MSEKQQPSSVPKHSFFSFSSFFGSSTPATTAIHDTSNTKLPPSSNRRYSNPITPDQALNLSRATASASTNIDTSPLSRVVSADPKLPSPNKPVPVPSNRTKRKRRESTAYQSIGIVAAYSGGPSSF